jgi:hypothetical protein
MLLREDEYKQKCQNRLFYKKNTYTGVQSKNNGYHIVDKVQNSYGNTLKFALLTIG